MTFYKFQGTGNDFVMIDNRGGHFPKGDTNLVAHLCHRRFGIGADGLILLEEATGYDFRMVYYNSDGNQSSMCGNGGRCIVAFAKLLGIIDRQTKFIATDGEHHASINADGIVELQMQEVHNILVDEKFVFLNTGSPHHVQLVGDTNSVDVKKEGAAIRYGLLYNDKGGSNVNFVTQITDDAFRVRTYERGVEDETYSCGTGVTATAIAMYELGKTKQNKIKLHTPGGGLSVSFEKKNGIYRNVWLSGAATFVFKGEISCRI